jgi:hypothetical protein
MLIETQWDKGDQVFYIHRRNGVGTPWMAFGPYALEMIHVKIGLKIIEELYYCGCYWLYPHDLFKSMDEANRECHRRNTEDTARVS